MAGFREGKNVFKNNDVAQVREVTDTELVLHDGRRMHRDGARIDQGVCITSHASQCRMVDQVVVLPDGADAKGWYVSLSRAREAMHVCTRDKSELRQSVMQPGETQVSRRLGFFGPITKEANGIHGLPGYSLFGDGIPRRLLLRVSLARPTSVLSRF